MLSIAGFKYLLTCVDACTKFTWVFLFKLILYVVLTFTHFLTAVEVEFNIKVKSAQNDGGGEFTALTSVFNSKGIAHRLACPHTHHHNGSVERKDRHVIETGPHTHLQYVVTEVVVEKHDYKVLEGLVFYICI